MPASLFYQKYFKNLFKKIYCKNFITFHVIFVIFLILIHLKFKKEVFFCILVLP